MRTTKKYSPFRKHKSPNLFTKCLGDNSQQQTAFLIFIFFLQTCQFLVVILSSTYRLELLTLVIASPIVKEREEILLRIDDVHLIYLNPKTVESTTPSSSSWKSLNRSGLFFNSCVDLLFKLKKNYDTKVLISLMGTQHWLSEPKDIP